MLQAKKKWDWWISGYCVVHVTEKIKGHLMNGQGDEENTHFTRDGSCVIQQNKIHIKVEILHVTVMKVYWKWNWTHSNVKSEKHCFSRTQTSPPPSVSVNGLSLCGLYTVISTCTCLFHLCIFCLPSPSGPVVYYKYKRYSLFFKNNYPQWYKSRANYNSLYKPN